MPATRKAALTDRALQALKPDGRRYAVWDAALPGLAVRVTGKGKRSFYAVRRRAGARQPTWALLGAYPAMGLAEARAAARQALAALTEGRNPVAEARAGRAAARAAEASATDNTFSAVAENFIRLYVTQLRSARTVENTIRDKLIPALGHRPITEIRRREIITVIESIAAKHGIAAARSAHGIVSKLFNWAIARDIDGLDANPAARCQILPPPKARDRVLTDDEVRTVWTGISKLNTPWREFYQVLLLTGQRRGEIGNASWHELDLQKHVLTIPGERMKTGKAHIVPLTPTVVEIFRGLPRFTGGDFVFTTSGGRRPIQDISHAKDMLNDAVGDAIRPWRTHDLRRTVRTNLSSLGVAPFIAELVIGHTQSGVHAVYDRHRYDAEKRAALELWEKRLFEIVGPEPKTVILFTGKRVHA